MAQPAAKQGDTIVGTDKHVLMVPSPGGPLPLPFSGQLDDALKTETTKTAANPRVWLLILVLFACALGSNPHGAPQPSNDGDAPGLAPLAISCPAYDASVFPADLGVSATPATFLTTPGSFAVSRTGEATYTIPLIVPPGRAGMEPSLAIAYGSAAGEGFLGVGFGLQGLSAITRCPANLAQDGFIRPVKYDSGDHFCLDGARLVQIAEQLAHDGSGTREYRTFPDTFAKIVGHVGAGEAARGPLFFEALTKAGRIIDYGAAATGRAMATKGVVAAWWVTEERDRRGNALAYTYDNDTDPGDGHTLEIVPARIEYAHRPDHTPLRAVVFESSTAPSTSTLYSGGLKLRRTKELDKITMVTEPGGVAVHTYYLAYDTGASTGRTLLQSVLECAGPTGGCKPATSFTWSSHAAGGLTKTSREILADNFGHQDRMTWLLADVNGDGLDDLVVSHPSADDDSIDEWWVSLNTGGDYATPTRWASFPYHGHPVPWNLVPIDYDQDGLTDIFLDALNADDMPTYQWLHATRHHTFELRDTGIPRPPGISASLDEIASYRFLRLGDVNGDGMADLIQCVNPQYDGDDPTTRRWTVHLWSPSLPGGPGFEPTPRSIPFVDKVLDCGWGQRSIYVADVDGDGVASLVVPFTGGTFGAIRHVAGDEWTSGPLHLFRDPSRQFTMLHFLDTNGDGLTDVIMTGLGQNGCDDADGNLVTNACSSDTPTPNGKWSSDLPFLFTNTGGTGATFTDPMPTLPGPLVSTGWTDGWGDAAIPIDYDGDGRMDLLMPVLGTCGSGSQPTDVCWVALVSGSPGGALMTPVNTHVPVVINDDDYGAVTPWYAVQVTDVDGDGRHDLVGPDPDDPTRFSIYKNDGPQDLLTAVFDGTNPLDPWDPGAIPNVAIRYGNLVDEAITKGIPPVSLDHDDLTYVARSDPDNDCAFPRACVVGAERVVQSYVFNNGQNGERAFQVKYRDGRYHRLGRGFLGFGERTILDEATAGGVSESYDNVTFDATFDAFPYAGQVVRSRAWSATRADALDPGQVEMAFTDRTLEQVVPTNDGKTYFTLPAITSATRQEGTMQPGPGKSVLRFVQAAEATPATVLGQSWHVVASYDGYGNVLQESSHTEGVDLFDVTTRTYDDDPDTWLIGLLHTEVACSTSLGITQCRSTQLGHDEYGQVTSATTGDPADADTRLVLSLGRDAFGAVTFITANDDLGDYRASCVSYDADNLFPYATVNALGQVAYTRFDPAFGVLTAAVDVNGLATRWQRDVFGSVTEELRPDGTKTTVSLTRTKDGGPHANWYNARVTTEETGGALTTTELDAIGRPVHTWTIAAAVQSCGVSTCKGALQLEQETVYDFLGRVTHATLPWMTGDSLLGERHHDYAYDAAGRVTKHTEPWGRVTTFKYGDNVTSATDWLGTSSAAVDALGRVILAKDKKGYPTETTYGPFGARWSVTRNGDETTTSEHDAYGRVVHETDPDRGETQIAYDGFGEAVTTDDAKVGDVLTRHYAFAYDALGRLVRREDPDGVVEWAYDSAPHGVGKIASVTNPRSVKQYLYDTLSRSAMEALTLTDSGEVMTAGYDYDNVGRLQTIAYPEVPGVDPLVVRREYDPYGNLVSVHDNANGTVYWRLNGLDGAGRPAVEAMGSGITVRRTYDPSSGLVQHITANKLTAGPIVVDVALQDLHYAYDEGLRMRSRADHLQIGPKGVRTELFEHDELDRLTCARFADVPAGAAAPVRGGEWCALGLAYDPNGNIKSKSDVGAYTYDPAHPHAVQTAGGASYGYDAVGNQTTRPDAAIDYTAFDLPSVFTPTNGDRPTAFTYDGDQQRIRKSGASETVYFEGLYERVTDAASGVVAHRYYVAAGSATVVLTRQAGGSNHVAYLHTDALGSTDVVTDGTGNVAGNAGERRSYDAFGARRSPAWGQAPPAGGFAPKVSPIGFTGHEGDDELGLINMRGRIYDAGLGRFLSTDPIVSRPHFGQSWNPYSYVLNSPLNFVDPSGFEDTPVPQGVVEADGRSYAVPGLVVGPGPGFTMAQSLATRGDPSMQRDAARDDTPAHAAPVPDVPAAPTSEDPSRAPRAEREAPRTWRDDPRVIAAREFSRGAAGGLIPFGPQLDALATQSGHLPQGTPDEQKARGVGQIFGGVLGMLLGKGGAGASEGAGPGPLNGGGGAALALARTHDVGTVILLTAWVNLASVLHSTGSGRPPSLSPAGAGRSGAFAEAKRRNGVPAGQQPTRVLPNVDRSGKPQPGRIYEFKVPTEGGEPRTVRIRDDTAGHDFGPGNPQNRGPHFNDDSGNHYDY